MAIHIHIHKKVKDSDFTNALQNALQAREITNKASLALKAFPKGQMGLVSDEIKNSEGFKKAKSFFNQAFENEKKFNQILLRNFKKEYEAYVKANRGH